MNTAMADGAGERLDAQIADALFGQPGMSKMDVANRLRQLRGAGAPLLCSSCYGLGVIGYTSGQTPEQFEQGEYPCPDCAAQPSPAGHNDALVDTARRNIRQFLSKASFSSSVDKQAALSCVDVLEEALAARQPVGISAEWVLGYLTTHAPEDSREAIRNAFAEHAALSGVRQPVGQSFQSGVSEWMDQCFLPSLYSDMTERGDRLLEEVLELLQAHGYDKARVPTLVDYVFSRPVGDPAQEVGGVMVTLAGYCWVAGLDMHVHGHAELARISHPEVMAKIRAKQDAKNALHFDTPLPGNVVPRAQAVDPADPWRGLYSPDLMPKLDGVNLYHVAHPDLPSWPKDEDEERGIGPLITAQGFAIEVVFGEYPDDDGEEVDYCAWLASWTPDAPAGADWRMVCIQDTEDGPAAFYVRPLALIDSKAVGK
ncbi:MAG: hypothetical protein KH046_00615 [Stenotrophomonas maltophilia]|uniref:hypothetical protein n=1 Tax=Stenotrophomonas maltophilia TaxID=40324 RepID=UPI001953EA44|nr:hypothetical protein [Stenotrophomonas maltophilia]MBS4799322.1 hypothetical protein [Stenotrophomonas maltophilia]